MKNNNKTNEQLLYKIGKLSNKIAVLEKSLTKSKHVKEKFKLLSLSVEQSTEGIAHADLNGNLIYVNKAWCKMHGYKSSKNLLGKNLEIFHNKKQLENDVIPFNNEVKKNGTCTGEVGHITKEGKTFQTLMTSTLLKDAQGNPFAMIGIARDITERLYAEQAGKQAEEALEKSERRFSLLMQQSPSVIEIYALDGLQISVNKAYEKLWGFPASHTLNKFNVLKSKEVKDTGLLKYVTRAYDGEAVSVPEYKFNPTGETEAKGIGRIRWLSTNIYPLKDHLGKVNNIVITHEDITNRKQAAEKQRQSEELNRSITQAATDAIIAINSDGIILSWNKSAKKIFGYSSVDMVNKKLSKILPAQHKTGHIAGIKQLKMGGKAKLVGKTIEITARRKDGTEFPIELSLSSWEADNKKYYTGIIRDITVRKQAEEKLISRNKELELFNEVTVGRELKMIELKKEINELLKKSGKKPKYKIPI